MEHRTPMEHRNTGGSIRIPKNGETWEEQRNNGTTKKHQEVLPIQNDAMDTHPVKRHFPCNKSAQEIEKKNIYTSVVIFWI